ncbi:HAD-IIB family hydrolase [Paenibacillus sp. DMB20]|uniref:HAD-IIB family hydrolase n=1 Tax=Paenibacillus sp. DMB20 TaxID=1642570 RepID=UPI000A84E7BF
MNSQPILYLDELDMKMNVQQHARVDSSYEPLKIPVPGYDPGYYVERDIYQAIVFCTQEEEGFYLNKYANKLQFVRWGDHAVDVLPMGGSKAAGIARLIQKLGKKPEDAVAFGDHLNDLEMLQYVGHGVAMGNALPVVKKIASHVTTDVDRDGILHGLRHLGLIRAANVS